MKNPHEKGPPEADALLEDFLDHVCAPLVGVVPYRERQAIRREIGAHLDALVAEHEFQGQSPDDAANSALREMGEPWAAGQAWLEAWSAGRQTSSSASRLARASLTRPFAFFGVAAMLNWLLLEQCALTPGGDWLLPFVVLFAAVAPIVCGVCVGASQPGHPTRGVLPALLILCLHALATGLLMLPSPDGLHFAAVPLVWWLPVGLLSSSLVAALIRSHRRHRFLRAIE